MKLHVEIAIFISMFKDLSIIIFRKKALVKISTIPPPKSAPSNFVVYHMKLLLYWSCLWWGREVNEYAGHHGQPTTVLKLHWLKFPITVPKFILNFLFLNFLDFLAGIVKASQQKDHSFYNRVSFKTSLILQTSTHSALRKKNLTHFTNFRANMFLVGFRKSISICTASFLDAQEMHSESAWKPNVRIFIWWRSE